MRVVPSLTTAHYLTCIVTRQFVTHIWSAAESGKISGCYKVCSRITQAPSGLHELGFRRVPAIRTLAAAVESF